MSADHRRPPPRRATAGKPGRTVEVTVERLGGRGDGVAFLDGEPLFVAAALPGERVVARIEGRRGDGLAGHLLQVLTPGPDRVAPPCPHYGACGGCTMQHVAPDTYRGWKRGLLVEALGHAGLAESLVAPLIALPPGRRRRASLAFLVRRGRAVLGFNARASHQVVDIASCLLLAPPLNALLAPLRGLLAEVVADGGGGDAHLTLCETGADLMIEAPSSLGLFERERLARFAQEHDLARLSWRRPGDGPAEPVARQRPPVVRFAGIAVEPPAGGFLQPSAEGERALAALVFDAVGAASPVADLFAGCGSFSFPLSQKALVHAVEGDGEACQALKAAADRAQARLTVERRDLTTRPLSGDELKRFAAVVFDPPRAGAPAQAEHLAADGPPLVVAVSCNPATLTRDARLLMGGGYHLTRATPVDQFPFSAHLETVAVFAR